MTQNIRNKNIEIFKNLIEDKFGRKIEQQKHCQDLEEQLINEIKVKISYKTLARFFEITKSDSKISLHNLDALSVYIGFKNFDEFEKDLKNKEVQTLFEIDNNLSKPEYWSKTEEICKERLNNPEKLVRLHHDLMEYPLARLYFMEQHPMRDLIGTVYSQYFIEYLKYATTPTDKVFAYSFLYIGAFLTENHEMMRLYNQILSTFKNDSTDRIKRIFVLPAAHRYGVLLQQADFTKKGFSKLFKEMLSERKNYIDASERCVCSFEFTVLEHLIFTDRNKEMLKLVELQTHQKEPSYYYVPEERINTHQKSWVLLCAWAYWRNGKIEDAITTFNTVQLSDFCVGWQKFYGALYYILKLHLFELEEEVKKETLKILNSIISETNFTYLRRYLTTVK